MSRHPHPHPTPRHKVGRLCCWVGSLLPRSPPFWPKDLQVPALCGHVLHTEPVSQAPPAPPAPPAAGSSPGAGQAVESWLCDLGPWAFVFKCGMMKSGATGEGAGRIK